MSRKKTLLKLKDKQGWNFYKEPHK